MVEDISEANLMSNTWIVKLILGLHEKTRQLKKYKTKCENFKDKEKAAAELERRLKEWEEEMKKTFWIADVTCNLLMSMKEVRRHQKR